MDELDDAKRDLTNATIDFENEKLDGVLILLN